MTTMALAISPGILSGSINGRPIPVAAITSPGTLIHTATSVAGAFDQIDLDVTNVTGTAATITVEWGGTTDPGDHLVKNYSIPAYTKMTLAAGLRLSGGVIVRAFAGTANALNITGSVATVTP